jgi:hypothetical protein
LLSFELSATDEAGTAKMGNTSGCSGTYFNKDTNQFIICNINDKENINFGNYTSRNSRVSQKSNDLVNMNVLNSKYHKSDESDSIFSKELFEFSPSDMKKMSPIVKEKEESKNAEFTEERK